LSIRPDDIWLLILQGAAQHFSLNAEKLRSTIVSHFDKPVLNIDDSGQALPKFVDMFVQAIQANVQPKWANVFHSKGFSTTTPMDVTAQQMTIMDICKQYFTYRITTRCGFPYIRLEGTQEDWESVYDLAVQLLDNIGNSFTNKWKTALLSVLTHFKQVWKGPVNVLFWDSMVKRGAVHASGGGTYYNGWLNVFLDITISHRSFTRFFKFNKWINWCYPIGEFLLGLEWSSMRRIYFPFVDDTKIKCIFY
jgi:hypothetical protein